LQNARKAIRAYFLQGAEIPWTGVRNQEAGLVQRLAIAAIIVAGVSHWVVLRLNYPTAILHKVIWVVGYVKCLDPQLKYLTLADDKAARQAHINPLQPRTVKGVEANARRRS